MTASGLPSEGGELNSPKVLEELLVLPPAAVGEELPHCSWKCCMLELLEVSAWSRRGAELPGNAWQLLSLAV